MLQGQGYNEKVCILLNFRAQDKAAMQLSELEEEMDQRIQAAEHKTRKDVSLWDGPFMRRILRAPFMDRAPGILWVQQVQTATGALNKGIVSAGGFVGGLGGESKERGRERERERDSK